MPVRMRWESGGTLPSATFQISYRLKVDGELRAGALSVHAAVDHDGRPARLPGWLPPALKAP